MPDLAIRDGALGFWAALEEVDGETAQQRCWMHETINALNYLSKSVQAKVKQAAPHAIWQAEIRADAEKAFDLFLKTYEPKYPKATLCVSAEKPRGVDGILRLPSKTLAEHMHMQSH